MKPEDYAFPFQPYNDQPHNGLTKREYFAAIALHAFLSNPEKWLSEQVGFIERARDFADCLIVVLNEPR